MFLLTLFRSLAGWSIDLKLGVRMLIKYPGLTLVGGLAIAFGIAAGAAAFEWVTQLAWPTLPLEEGSRIVAIRQWDAAAAREERRTWSDVIAWRDELKVVEDIGAFRTVERNLITDERGANPVEVAEISASAFRLARVPALVGRALLDADEEPGAPAVAVIGHDLWQVRFAGSPAVIGRTVRLGDAPATIIGVMPAGFAFPIAHSAWVPLRLSALEYGGREGPELRVFGRLARDVSMGEAQAAVQLLGDRAAAESPDTHTDLRPEVLPYAKAVLPLGEVALGGMVFNVFLVMFFVLICANVGALVFARAIAREREILVRTALGASRGRIVMQLFAEALALGSIAAAAGLAAAGLALQWSRSVARAEAGGRLPFWLTDDLSWTTVLYAGALTIGGAVVAGVLPALKVTGRRIEGQLRQTSAGLTDARFSGIWTAVIVAQVAVTVAFPAATVLVRQQVRGIQSFDVGFPAPQYLSARLELDRDMAPRAGAMYDEVKRRLADEPGVAGVTSTDRLPRTNHPKRRIEIEGEAPDARSAGPLVSIAAVAEDYFDVLGAGVLSGRGFRGADMTAQSGVVVVNRAFAERVLAGRNPAGRRVRYSVRDREPASPWYEIVGVVPDLGIIDDGLRHGAAIYHPAPPDATTLHLALHMRQDPASFAPRLRAIIAAVDPAIRVHELLPLDEVGASGWTEMDFAWRLLVLVSVLALLLSLAAIYAITSLAVSRRTREIGIRLALGAAPHRVVAAMFSRPLAQVAAGVLVGGALVFALTRLAAELSIRDVVVIAAYMLAMTGVCLLACAAPTRRALRVEPTDALRTD